MNLRNNICLLAGLLAVFSGNVFGLQVVPSSVQGLEGESRAFEIVIAETDWEDGGHPTECISSFNHFVVDVNSTGSAVRSNSDTNGDFFLDEDGVNINIGEQLIFCVNEFMGDQTYVGYYANFNEDADVESDETAQVTFSAMCGETPNQVPCSSNLNITINDNSPIQYTASIVATSPDAAEPNAGGEFTIYLDQPAEAGGVIVEYEVSVNSTATQTEDFELSGDPDYILIQGGAMSGTVPVVVLDDGFVESDETVIVNLVPSAINTNYVVGAPGSATVTISDDDGLPVVTLVATSPNASEPGVNGAFTISLDKPAGVNGLEVYYDLSKTTQSTATEGADFAAFGGSLTIAAGQSSASIPVSVIDDSEIEGDETVVVELNESLYEYDLGSPYEATVTIADDDQLPVVTISGENADENGPPIGQAGSFTITLDSPAPTGGLTVSYGISPSSTATEGEDFMVIGTSVMIPANQTSASIPLVGIDDELVEGSETVIVDILTSAAYDLGSPSSVTVDIIDDDATPVVSVTASRAEEPGPPDGNNGKFIFSLNQPAPTEGLTVDFSVLSTSTAISGVDYEALGTSVDFPAGADSVEVPVVVIDDDLHEGSESVNLQIQTGSSYDTSTADSATVFIVDDETGGPDPEPIPTVNVAGSNGAEPSTNGRFTFNLSTPAPEGGLIINFTVSGSSTATQSSDYQPLPSSVTVAAGSSSADIAVTVIDDSVSEGSETVIVDIESSTDYELGSAGSATVTIADDDAAGLYVSATSLTTTEAGGAEGFNVSLKTEPSSNVVVNVTSSQTAEGIVEPASLVFTSSNWSSAQQVTVTGVDDDAVDGDVEYSVRLVTSSSDSNYAAVAPVVIMAINLDNDEAPAVEFPQATFTVTEDVGTAEVTIERSGSGSGAQSIERPRPVNGKLANTELTVIFSTDDNNPGTTATPGEDYTPVNETLIWPAGDYTPRTVTIAIVNDADVEGDETIVLKLEVVGNNSPIYSDLVVSNDFVEDVISNIDPSTLPLNQQSITEVILTSCPTGMGQGGFQELCTDLVVEALEGGSVLNPLIEVTPDDAGAARTPAVQSQTVQNINVNGRQSALRGGAAGLSTQGFTVGMAGFNMNAGMFKNFGSGYDSIQADATNPFSNNYLSNSLVPNKANASGDDDNDFGRWGVWVSGKAVFGDKDNTAREQGYDFDTAGLTVGVDYRFTDNLVAGAAFGYANNDINMNGNSGKLDTTGLTGTIYGSYYPSANFYMDASISLGMNSYKQHRKVAYQLNQIGASVDEEFKADYDGDQTSFTFGTGYDFNKNGWIFGPTFFVEYIDIDVDPFDEKLISSANPSFTLGWATHINKQNYESLIPEIGMQFSKAFSQTWGVIVPSAHVSWAKELKSDNSMISGYFLGDVGQVNFNLLTDDLDEDFFKAGIGVSAMFQNNKSAFLSVDGDFGRQLFTVYYINAGFRWEF